MISSDFRAQIPSELQAQPHWVAFKLAPSTKAGDKPRKLPVNPRTGDLASSTDPATWAGFEAALWRKERDGLAGIGFVLTDSGLTGIDLDGCREKATGRVAPAALGIVGRFDSYTEVSFSGTGLHIIVRGLKPEGRCRTTYQGIEIECYSSGRYFVTTGAHLAGTPQTVNERSAELADWHRELFGDQRPDAPALPVSTAALDFTDAELLERAYRWRNGDELWRLMHGDTSPYGGDESRCDFALCRHLAFLFGNDPARIDGVFRRSDLMRPKWDARRGKQTYGQLTIWRAIGATERVYRG